MTRKSLVRREEDFAEWLVERAVKRNGPEWPDEGHKAGWESWLLDHWPKWLTLEWWTYLFGRYDRTWHDLPWLALPSPITDTYEWRWWFKSERWRFVFTDETRLYRIYCRLRGHPHGEIYYNPGGSEPDHHCQDCGEEIG